MMAGQKRMYDLGILKAYIADVGSMIRLSVPHTASIAQAPAAGRFMWRMGSLLGKLSRLIIRLLDPTFRSMNRVDVQEVPAFPGIHTARFGWNIHTCAATCMKCGEDRIVAIDAHNNAGGSVLTVVPLRTAQWLDSIMNLSPSSACLKAILLVQSTQSEQAL